MPFLPLKDGHCFRANVAAMFERAKVEPVRIVHLVQAGGRQSRAQGLFAAFLKQSRAGS